MQPASLVAATLGFFIVPVLAQGQAEPRSQHPVGKIAVRKMSLRHTHPVAYKYASRDSYLPSHVLSALPHHAPLGIGRLIDSPPVLMSTMSGFPFGVRRGSAMPGNELLLTDSKGTFNK